MQSKGSRQFLEMAFQEDARQALDNLKDCLSALEGGAQLEPDYDQAMRALHSIKGTAATLDGWQILSDIAHLGEDAVQALRVATSLEREQLARFVWRLVHIMSAYLADPDGLARTGSVEYQQLQGELAGVLGNQVVVTAAQAWTVGVVFDSLSESDVASLRTELEIFGEITDVEQESGAVTMWLKTDVSQEDLLAVCAMSAPNCQVRIVPSPVFDSEPALHDTPPSVSSSVLSSVRSPESVPVPVCEPDTVSLRVERSLLDRISRQFDELTNAQSVLDQTLLRLWLLRNSKLRSDVEQLRVQTEALRSLVREMICVPLSDVFAGLAQYVQDTARTLDKQVRLSCSGLETRCHKPVAFGLLDATNQLVRNCLDHGIESPQERAVLGKPLFGTIEITCHQSPSLLTVQVRDDGRGLSRENLVRVAASKGIAVDAGWPDQAIWQLIFEPGLSTAAKVSSLSGRGVGMDAVRARIAQLDGTIEVESNAGQGVVFTIRIGVSGLSAFC